MIDYTLPLDELPDPLPIVPLERPFDVTITPPGSKSITNRAYVLAALADGESRIIRPLRSEDTDGLLDALCTLGAQARWDGEDVFITGVNGRFPRGGSVNLGDGGTPTRFMIAAACLAAEPVIVDGSKRMRERPIAEGVDMLRKLGATIEYVEDEGRLPVRVVPSDNFKGGELTVGKTASSQFISAVMLIASHLPNGVSLMFSAPGTSSSYIYLTTWTLEQWATDIDFGEQLPEPMPGGMMHRRIRVAAQPLVAGTYTLEPDASSCAYWYSAAVMMPGARAIVPLQPFASCQPDRVVGMTLAQLFGCDFELIQGWGGQVCNSGIVGPARLIPAATINDAELTPDSALVLAAVVAHAESGMTITGLHTLRVKETDRIAALANELRKVGCAVETTDDSITITPSSHRRDACATGGTGVPPVDPVTIETYNDHRMAMSFAVLGLVRPGISIANPKCVAKSYPTFWRDFAKLYQGPDSGGGG